MISWRWRNHIRRIASHSTFRSIWARVPRSYPKLFIVGAPRSGTTWINLIFANHPRVVTENESLLYPVILNTITKHGARNPETWRRLAEAYRNPVHHTVGIHRFISYRAFRRILAEMQSNLNQLPGWTDEYTADQLVRRVIDHFFYRHLGTDRHLFVEKTPAHVLYSQQILNAFPEAKILHVIRDGRDVCASLEARSKMVDWAPEDRRKQIDIWKSHVEAGLTISDDSRYADRVATVRYEDVLADPVCQVTRLFEFAGVPVESGLVERVVEQTKFRKHRNKGPGKHNNKGVAGNWRNHFSAEDERLFAELAGDLSARCGYEMNAQRRAA